MQNAAARLVTRSKKADHITPVLKSLHWLPVHRRIEYKMLLLTFKTLHGLAPCYMRELLTQKANSARNLRSNDMNLLLVPKSRTVSYGDRDFRIAAPKLWNGLPEYIRKCESLPEFKSFLKTHLFRKSFTD